MTGYRHRTVNYDAPVPIFHGKWEQGHRSGWNQHRIYLVDVNYAGLNPCQLLQKEVSSSVISIVNRKLVNRS